MDRVGRLSFKPTLPALAAAVVFLHGCGPTGAPTLLGGGKVVCKPDLVQIPSTFPVIVGVGVEPTADGFVELILRRRWRFTDGGIRPFSQGEQLSAAAWEGTRTAAAELNRVTIWEADRAVTCAEPARPVSSVGLQSDSVLWTDWVVVDQSTSVYRATFSEQGCSEPQLVNKSIGSNRQFTQPTILGGRNLALQTSILREFDLVEFEGDGGINSWSRLSGRARLCGSADSLLVATAGELVHFDPDGGSNVVTTFPAAAGVSDCNGANLALSIDAPDGSTIVEYSTLGQELSRQQVAGAVGGLGLAHGGWVILDNVLRGRDGRLVETPETVLISDTWANGDTFMASIGRGPILRWRDSTWQPVIASNEEDFREVPDGLGGTPSLTT